MPRPVKYPLKYPPKPLTATPLASLDTSRPDAPVSTRFDDVYFSVDDGLAETRAVYLQGCGLPERWASSQVFTIGELGFGSGLNFLAAWQLWREHRPSPAARLHFISVEGYPLSHEQLSTALSQWGELSELSEQLLTRWPGRVYGQHRIDLPDGVSLTVCHDPVEQALAKAEFKANAWFLDGFTPAKNSDMWSEAVMARLFDLSADGAVLATFTAAGDVRRALSAAGFDVVKRAGFGRKRDRLEAVKPESISTALSSNAPARAPIIIGAGIAGASLARSFLARGITPILIDADDDSAASGNPAAIVKPRLDLQDRPESRFYLSAYLYAVNAYSDTSGAVLHRGIAHAGRGETDLKRFEKLTAQQILPPQHMQAVGADYIESQTGVRPERGGLWFGSAVAIDPIIVTQSWTDGARRISARAEALRRSDSGWEVLDAAGEILASADDIYIANGAGIASLIAQSGKEALPDIRYLRGQITWSAAPDSVQKNGLKNALVYGGYAIRRGDDLLLGASHGRADEADLKQISMAENIDNIDGFNAAGGESFAADDSGLKARAAMRVATHNTMPRIGSLDAGLSVITGLGGRGFSFAPLLAEHLVARQLGEPHALASDCVPRFWV